MSDQPQVKLPMVTGLRVTAQASRLRNQLDLQDLSALDGAIRSCSGGLKW